MSCPEIELIKCLFHKNAHNRSAHSSELILWLIRSLILESTPFYFAIIGQAQRSRICTGKCFWNKEKYFDIILTNDIKLVLFFHVNTKLIQSTFTNITLPWFSDTCTTLFTKRLWHHSASNSKLTAEWLTCYRHKNKNVRIFTETIKTENCIITWHHGNAWVWPQLSSIGVLRMNTKSRFLDYQANAWQHWI